MTSVASFGACAASPARSVRRSPFTMRGFSPPRSASQCAALRGDRFARARPALPAKQLGWDRRCQRDRDRALLAKSHAGALSGPALSHSPRTKRRAGPVGPPMDARDPCRNHIHTDRPSGRDPQMRRPRSRPRGWGRRASTGSKVAHRAGSLVCVERFSMIARIASSFSLRTCLNWHQPEGVPKRRRVAANKRFG